MSTMARIVLHLISTFFMLGCFLFLLSSMLTNHWRGGGIKTNTTETYYYEGLLKFCVETNDESVCSDIEHRYKSDDIKMKRNITRAVLTVAIFFAIFGFGLSVIALCKRTRTIHVRYQFFVILSLFISLGCGIVAAAYYMNHFGTGVNVLSTTLSIDYGWQYSLNLAWAGAILVMVPLVIAIYDTVTFPRDEYEAAG